jgi:hypothetical protein
MCMSVCTVTVEIHAPLLASLSCFGRRHFFVLSFLVCANFPLFWLSSHFPRPGGSVPPQNNARGVLFAFIFTSSLYILTKPYPCLLFRHACTHTHAHRTPIKKVCY